MTSPEIPKIIHYCWFGRGEKSELIQRCMESWARVLPEWEVIEWNEDNFDVDCTRYTRQAYDRGKWAFVSDYARLWALRQMGGVYLDTDVEVLRPLDRSHKEHPLLEELSRFYEEGYFVDANGCMNTYTTVMNATDILMAHGMKLDMNRRHEVAGAVVYPKVTFCPGKAERESRDFSPETYAVHHYAATWRDDDYNRKLENPAFAAALRASGAAGQAARKVLGEERWVALRNGRLKKLYDLVRGV